MKLRKIQDIGDVSNKFVIVRADFNVPLKKTTRRYVVSDETKLKASLETISFLQKKKAKIILLSHLGRPEGKRNTSYSLQPIKPVLSKLLQTPVLFANGYTHAQIQHVYNKVKQGQCLLLENLRFYEQEEENDAMFAKQLSELGIAYINDAFASCHRAHASVEGITRYISSYAGFLIQKEIQALDRVKERPKPPSILILGGVKMETKLPLLEYMVNVYDYILLGGALANTFLVASGYAIGSSIYEERYVDFASDLLRRGNIVLPSDVRVAHSSKVRKHALDISLAEIEKKDVIYDIGDDTIATYCSLISKAKTIVWNGPMGYYEHKLFEKGSKKIASALIQQSSKSFVVVGGGETLDIIKNQKDFEHIDHVSTGGGAMLSYLSGQLLPGLEVLKK